MNTYYYFYLVRSNRECCRKMFYLNNVEETCPSMQAIDHNFEQQLYINKVIGVAKAVQKSHGSIKDSVEDTSAAVIITCAVEHKVVCASCIYLLFFTKSVKRLF